MWAAVELGLQPEVVQSDRRLAAGGDYLYAQESGKSEAHTHQHIVFNPEFDTEKVANPFTPEYRTFDIRFEDRADKGRCAFSNSAVFPPCGFNVWPRSSD